MDILHDLLRTFSEQWLAAVLIIGASVIAAIGLALTDPKTEQQ